MSDPHRNAKTAERAYDDGKVSVRDGAIPTLRKIDTRPVAGLVIAESPMPNQAFIRGDFSVNGFAIGWAMKPNEPFAKWTVGRGRRTLTDREACITMLRKRIDDARLKQSRAAVDEMNSRAALQSIIAEVDKT